MWRRTMSTTMLKRRGDGHATLEYFRAFSLPCGQRRRIPIHQVILQNIIQSVPSHDAMLQATMKIAPARTAQPHHALRQHSISNVCHGRWRRRPCRSAESRAHADPASSKVVHLKQQLMTVITRCATQLHGGAKAGKRVGCLPPAAA